MIWNKWIRQFHRWVAITFTVTVIVCFAALTQNLTPEDPAFVVFYVPLLPLALLMFSGLYLFALPYTSGATADAPLAPREASPPPARQTRS